jgi:hypothetical protein
LERFAARRLGAEIEDEEEGVIGEFDQVITGPAMDADAGESAEDEKKSPESGGSEEDDVEGVMGV